MTDGISDAFDTRDRCRACGHKVHPVNFTCPDCHKDIRGDYSEDMVEVTIRRTVKLRVVTQLDSPCLVTEVFDLDDYGEPRGAPIHFQYWKTKEEAAQGTDLIMTAIRNKKFKLLPHSYRMELK